MKIQNFQPYQKVQQPRAERQPPFSPPDQFVSSSDGKGALAAMGFATGAIGIGAPAALGLGAAKAFVSGHPLAGAALAVGSLATGGVFVPVSLMGAAMSTASGSSAGYYGYLAGAVAGVAGAALTIF